MNAEAHEPGAYHPVDSWASINTRWRHRTEMAIHWLGDVNSVADIGCGTMALKALLPAKTRYLAVDIAPRDADTIVVDLNRSPLPPLDVDAVTVLGVIEYLNAPETFLPQLCNFPRAIISYNHASLKDWWWKLPIKANAINWQNHVSEPEFRQYLDRAGLNVIRRARVRMGEFLYEVMPRSGAKTQATQSLIDPPGPGRFPSQGLRRVAHVERPWRAKRSFKSCPTQAEGAS